MTSNPSATGPSIEDDYRARVEADIRQHRTYAGRQLRRSRIWRVMAASATIAVPVLASVDGVSRVWLGVLGALAAITAEIQRMFRYHETSQHAMKTANALERELNLYVMAAGSYAIARGQGHTLFVERVEAIRAAEDKDFLVTWQSAAVAADRPEGHDISHGS